LLKKRINPISKKRYAQLAEEMKIRKLVCERAGGVFKWEGLFGKCLGGWCEVCGGLPMGIKGELEMSHEQPKGRGGVTSEANCKMLCSACHSLRHNLRNIYGENPTWSVK